VCVACISSWRNSTTLFIHDVDVAVKPGVVVFKGEMSWHPASRHDSALYCLLLYGVHQHPCVG
jgi:hypothetical protein